MGEIKEFVIKCPICEDIEFRLSASKSIKEFKCPICQEDISYFTDYILTQIGQYNSAVQFFADKQVQIIKERY